MDQTNPIPGQLVITTPEAIEALFAKLFDNYLQKIIPVSEQQPPIEIIDTAALCQRLDISEVTAIKYRKKKTIPFLKIGNSIRYNWSEVVKALSNNKKG